MRRARFGACAEAMMPTLWGALIAPISDSPTDLRLKVSSTDAPIDLERLLSRLDAIVREAGQIALGYFQGGAAKRWNKHDDSPVTEADIAVDRFLVERLPPLVEDSAWLSEETADTTERLSRRHVWIVDPIDGTRAFIEGRPEWVVSAALVEHGRPVAGVVRSACDDVTFSAALGFGAFRNGVRLRIDDIEGLTGMNIGGPQSLLNPLAAHGVVKGQWRYALANRLVQVAGGALDAALARPNAHDWDIAAAHVILEEAGGRLIGFDGAVPTYNRAGTRHGGLIAAAPARASALMDALADERAALENHR